MSKWIKRNQHIVSCSLSSFLLIGKHVFWFILFVTMQRPTAELADAGMRLESIFVLYLLPLYFISMVLMLIGFMQSLIGRGFGGVRFSGFSRIAGVLICIITIAIFLLLNYYFWPITKSVHAWLHPELANL